MKRYRLGLIAHDSKKEIMLQLLKAHAEIVSEFELVATKNTGLLVQEKAGLPVTLVKTESEGGDLQIGALVANGDVDAVIFLRDQLILHPYEPDVSTLLKVCDVHNVPLATNIATAEAVLHLIFEHPEALSGRHLAAQFLEELAAIHN